MTDPTTIPETPPASDEWAIVEIMGHRRVVGRIREEERFGAKMLRIDVPGRGDRCPECHGAGDIAAEGYYQHTTPRRPCKTCLGTGRRKDGMKEPEWLATQWYGGASLFAVTPCTEEHARRECSRNTAVAVPTMLTPPELPVRSGYREEDDDIPFDVGGGRR